MARDFGARLRRRAIASNFSSLLGGVRQTGRSEPPLSGLFFVGVNSDLVQAVKWGICIVGFTFACSWDSLAGSRLSRLPRSLARRKRKLRPRHQQPRRRRNRPRLQISQRLVTYPTISRFPKMIRRQLLLRLQRPKDRILRHRALIRFRLTIWVRASEKVPVKTHRST